MNNLTIKQELKFLFRSNFEEFPTNVKKISAGASEREIYRLSNEFFSCIGIFNGNVKENTAFIEFSKSFLKSGFNVPQIYAVSPDKKYYLEKDLGDITLANIGTAESENDIFGYYKESLKTLLDFQLKGINILDFSYCYQTVEFDFEQINYDITKFINYFINDSIAAQNSGTKYRFLFLPVADHLLKPKRNYFLYRDFQPRNIMVNENRLFFIDYQSGRKGALQYDVASLLYSGSNTLEPADNKLLLRTYLDELENKNIDTEEFMEYFFDFALIRLIQLLGSYSQLIKTRNDKTAKAKRFKALVSLESIYDEMNFDASKKLVETIVTTFNR